MKLLYALHYTHLNSIIPNLTQNQITQLNVDNNSFLNRSPIFLTSFMVSGHVRWPTGSSLVMICFTNNIFQKLGPISKGSQSLKIKWVTIFDVSSILVL